MTDNETGADHDRLERERPFPDEKFKRRVAYASMFFGGMFLEKLMSEEEEITTQDGRKLTIRHSVFDEIFGWPDEEETSGAPGTAEEPEPAIIVESQEPEMKDAQRPLRAPPRKKKKPQPQFKPANAYSTKNWPRY